MKPKIPNTQILQELERELKVREDVYPKWIIMGRVAQATANHRMAVFKQLIEEYKDKTPKVEQTKLL